MAVAPCSVGRNDVGSCVGFILSADKLQGLKKN